LALSRQRVENAKNRKRPGDYEKFSLGDVARWHRLVRAQAPGYRHDQSNA
jgi:hypothetical protein